MSGRYCVIGAVRDRGVIGVGVELDGPQFTQGRKTLSFDDIDLANRCVRALSEVHPTRAFWVAERLPDGRPDLDAAPARVLFAAMDAREIMMGGHA